MRRIALVGILLVVLAGAAWYLSGIVADRQLKVALDRSLRQMPPGYTASYGSVHYSLLSKHGAVRGISIRHEGAQPLTITIDELDVNQPNFDLPDAWSRAVADPAAVSPELALPVAGSATLHGLKLTAPQVTASEALLSVERPRVYPWPLLRPGLGTLPAALAQLESVPQPTAQDMLPLLRIETSWGLAVGYDGYTAESTKAASIVPATAQSPAVPVTYAIARMHGAAAERGRIGETDGEGVVADLGTNGSFTVDRIAIGAIDARQLLMRLLAAESLTPAIADGLELGNIEYTGMTFHAANGASATIGSISVSNIAVSHGVLDSLDVGLGRLKLVRDQLADPRAIELLQAWGLQTVTVSLTAGYRWNPDQGHVALHDTALRVDELGELQLAGEAVDVGPTAAEAAAGKLQGLTVRYRDASLMQRGLQYVAATQNSTPEAVRKLAIAGIEATAQSLGSSHAISAAVEQLVAFLEAPRTLTITLTPPRPVPLATLKDAASTPPAELFDTLGVTVSAQ